MGDSKSFYLPTRVITGLGCSQQLGSQARGLGRRALLVCSRGAAARSGFLDPLLASLGAAGVESDLHAQVQGEPTLQVVAEALGSVIFHEFLKVKRSELAAYDLHVHPWEREMYLEVI